MRVSPQTQMSRWSQWPRRIVAAGLLVLFVLPLAGWKSDSSYESVLKEWTRDDEAYNWTGIEARLVWHATYLSSSFRSAKVERYAELYQLMPTEVIRLKEAEQADGQKFDTFFISIYAGSRVYPDIGNDRSLWKLVLETSEGNQSEPVSWEEVPKNQVTRTLFPYIDRWSRLFEVKFPKSINATTKTAQLKMVGVPADSTLSWNLSKLRSETRQSSL